MRRLAFLLLLAGATAGAAVPAVAQSARSGEEVVRRLFEEAWNAGRYDNLASMLAPDFRFHFRGRINAMTPAQFQEMVASWRTVLPDLRFTIQDIVSNGDRIAARMTFTGTHSAPMWGIEPTGRTVQVTMMGFFRVADGRIAEMWEDYDEQGMRQQLTRPGG